MSFLTLSAITIVRAYGWENVQLGKCRRGDVLSSKCPLRKFPVAKVFVEELSFGEASGWITNLSVKYSQKNCFKELLWLAAFAENPEEKFFSKWLKQLLTDLQFLKEWTKVLLKVTSKVCS